MVDMITTAQRNKIFQNSKELKWDNDFLHEFIKKITGKESIKELTKLEAIEAINSMESKAGRKGWNNGYNRVSEKQIWKMKELAENLGWGNQPERLLGFVKKYYKVEALHWLTSHQAWRVIESLKVLLDKQHTEKKTS